MTIEFDNRDEEQELFINRRVMDYCMKLVDRAWKTIPHTFDALRAALYDIRDHVQAVGLPWPGVQISVDQAQPEVINIEWRAGRLVGVQTLMEPHPFQVVEMPTDTVDKEFLEDLVKEITNKQLERVRAVLTGLDSWLSQLKFELRDGHAPAEHEIRQWQDRIKEVMP